MIADEKVSALLRKKGMATNIAGFKYTKAALMLALEDNALKPALHKSLYPAVAKQFTTTPYKVERGIRYAIRKINDYNTNGQFISDCLEDLEADMRLKK